MVRSTCALVIRLALGLVLGLHPKTRPGKAAFTGCATAKLNDVDPQAWLADVLARMLDYPAKRIADLLPWNWHAEHRAAA